MKYASDVRKIWLFKRILPFVVKARSLGFRSLDDLLLVIQSEWARIYPRRKKLSRSGLYRALLRLRALGMDPGPDDRSTARKHGRPTRGGPSRSKSISV
jgi:hypothetical protein